MCRGRTAALYLGESPATVQAVTWVAAREGTRGSGQRLTIMIAGGLASPVVMAGRQLAGKGNEMDTTATHARIQARDVRLVPLDAGQRELVRDALDTLARESERQASRRTFGGPGLADYRKVLRQRARDARSLAAGLA